MTSSKKGDQMRSPREISKLKQQKKYRPTKRNSEHSSRDAKKFSKLLRSLEVSDLDDMKINNSSVANIHPINYNSIGEYTNPALRDKCRGNSKNSSKIHSKNASPILHQKVTVSAFNGNSMTHISKNDSLKYHITPQSCKNASTIAINTKI